MEEKFTKAIDILYLAKQNDVEIILNGDQLQLKIAKGRTIDKDLLKELQANKKLIIDLLSTDSWKSTIVNNSNNNHEIKRFDRDVIERIPLSFSQERLWFIDRLKGSREYHLPAVLRLTGDFDQEALSKALQEIVNRHEVLRTVYKEENGQVYQQIKPSGNWQLSAHDGSKYNGELESYIQGLIQEPFDLGKDDMLRAELISLGPGEHLLVVTMHHVASDAFSIPILVREVAVLYNAYSSGEAISLPALELQYADYAVWQRNHIQGEFLEEKLKYWKEKLEDVSPLQLPADYEYSDEGRTQGSSVFFEIDAALSHQVQELSQAQGATLYMTLLAAFKVLLYRYSGQEDICVGTSVANRAEQELDGLIGFFVNTLALRDQVNGDMSFTELLQEVKLTMRGAYRHQEVPFEKVVDAVVKERVPGLSPLFQIMLVLNNTPEVPELKLGELILSDQGYEQTTSKFDLTFFITETTDGLHGTVQYNTGLYTAHRIESMTSHFRELLQSAVTAPETQVGKLAMLNPAEQAELTTFAQSESQYPKDQTIAGLFEQQAIKHLDMIAIAFEGQQLSYRALNERANQLGHYLQSKGVKENTLVPLLMERGAEMLIAILGILKAGGAYVPIDTDFPSDRISYMLEDTKATIIVTSSTASDKLPPGLTIDIIELDEERATLRQQPTTTPTTAQQQDSLAYVIYTSGSTGKPKGVLVSNSNIADYVYGLEEKITISQSKSFALVSTIATDLGNTVLYGSLLTGGTLHVFTKETVSHIEAIHEYFIQHEIDCLKIVPSHWKALTLDGRPLLPKKQLIFGGEALQRAVVETIRNTNTSCKIINHYGPTETTIGKLLHEVDTKNNEYGPTIPIGKPFSNTSTYILTKELNPCPIGVPGQLYIAGEGLAKGYLNNPELTKEKFITHPITKERIYATGDKVQYGQDGNITFIGRVDDQVKIRGYRVEPGEVGRILEQSEQIAQAVVLAKDDKQGNKQLIGYIVTNDSYDKQELQGYLKEQLPDYMIPNHIVVLESFPLTANGKIDRRALPDPEVTTAEQYTAPRNETEAKLKAIWEEVLEIEDISITNDFFELGGHSLLAVRLISMIRKAFGMELPIADVFDYPTVAKLAERLTEEASTDLLPPVTAEQPRPEYIPLSFSQERLWFIDQLEGSVQYHIPAVLRLKGELNREALEHTLRTVIRRHEILRTVVNEHEGHGYQQILHVESWKLGVIKAREIKGEIEDLSVLITGLINRPFDLSKDYMLRADLIKLENQDHILVVTMHHIASDGWSKSILVKEVIAIYESYSAGHEINLPVLPLQYADYAIWQRRYMQGELLEAKLSYWREKLDEITPLQLPADYSRPIGQNSLGATHSFNIDTQLSSQLQALSQAHGATLYMMLLTAFKTLLHRYSAQEDICVGTSVANRPQQELEGLIGFCVNTLALRDQVKGDMSFIELLQEVKMTTLEAYAHQEVPFEKVVETVVKERVPGLSPLFQVMLVLNNTPEVPELKLGALRLTTENQEETMVKFDLTFFITETTDGLRGTVQYNTGLYTAHRIESMTSHFRELLQSAVTAPETQVGRLRMLSESEQNELTTFAQSESQYPKDQTIAGLFEQQAIKHPDTTAIAFEGQQLSYRALNERANQLGHYLQSKGVKENTLVPLLMERGPEMLIAILGILKAGGAYVPIDTDFPSDRISYMLDDTKATLVITSSATSDKLPQGLAIEIIEADEERATLRQQPTTKPTTAQTPDSLAYVIYTSGSTGKPKGVLVSNSNIADYVYGLEARITISQSKSFALVSTIATDLGNTVLFGSLLTGGTLHVFTKETVSHIEAIHEYFIQHEIDCLKIVPSHWKALTLDGQPLLPRKQLIFGGEALQRTVVETIQSTGTACKIINHYGPTETTIGKLVHEVDETKDYGPTIPIGKPFSNTSTYILTKELNPCPIGVPGQLYIAGEGLAKGYLNNPELTKEKFITHPITKERIYATGDKVQYQSDGNITFIGRVDDQVKIRGYRVEPGEVGRILEQSEQIAQAIVLAKDDKQGNKQLIGYIIAKEDYDKQELQAYLKEQLPDYMIPNHIVVLKSFPLTQNGKIDRRALPDPEVTQTEQYTAPRNETEAKLKAIWEEVLEIEDISINDDFFELGGHSLLAVRLISMIRKAFGMELPIADVFDYPTVAKLAERLTEEASTDLLPPVTAEQPRPEYIPLSFSQERLWFIDQLEGSVQYHIPAVIRLRGELNPEVLEKTLRSVIARHEVLRTVVVEHEGQGYQQVMDADNWALTTIEKAANEAGLNSYIAQLISRPFDLSKDYMLRAALIEIDEQEHILVVTMHHMVSDGWSRSILVKEVVALYEAYTAGSEAKLPELGVQYADYAIWQRRYMQGEVLQEKLNYWKAQLEDTAPLELPTDYSRPAVQGSGGAISSFTIGVDLSAKLKALSHQHGATLYMTLLSAFKVLLYRYSGQQDICVGTPAMGRNQQELEGLIGFFINTLALRSQVMGEMPFTGLLEAVKGTTLGAYAHQEVPFEKVVDAVVKTRDMSRSPLFQVMFSLQNTPDVPELKLGALQLSAATQEHTTAKFELSFMLGETSSGVHGVIEYSTDLYKAETIARMTGHYLRLLESIVAFPEEQTGRLAMLSGSEEQTLLTEFNDTQAEYPKDKSIVDLFEEQVKKSPTATAVLFEDKKLTYQELNKKSNQLARYLQQQGVKAETLVPVCVERSLEMLIGILGILKAGGAYVPIDPAYPAERISYMVADAGASIVLSSRASREKISGNKTVKVIAIDGDWQQIKKQESSNLQTEIHPTQLAYVIYTSGSTGKPKGVMIEHGSSYAFIAWCGDEFSSSQFTMAYATTSICFDLSVFELFYPLSSGKPVRILENGLTIPKYLNKDTAVLINTVPSVIENLQREKTDLSRVSVLNMAGEPIPAHVLEGLDTTTTAVRNLYGPTEDTTYSTICRLEQGKAVTIGRPIANTRVYILNRDQTLAPVGVAGELCLGGAGLARGYLNQPELTKEKFISDPFSTEPHARLYRTGDLARWLTDGNIEYLGRIDDQVKIRGYRIELGEIESVLNQSESIQQAVVLAKADQQGNKRLVGYVVVTTPFDKQAIQTYLSTRLPDYMVPAIWVTLESIPLTANGKTDKKALPDPELKDVAAAYVAPRNPTEQTLTEIWQHLLVVERVGIHDNFFELGGHSLLAMRVVSAIRKELNVELSIRDLFVYPNIAGLGAYLEEQAEGSSLPAITAGDRPEYIPLSFSQERLWFIDSLEGSLQYHVPAVLSLKGSLNIEALEKTLSGIISRHEILRTVILEHDGQGYQQIMSPDRWSLGITELTVGEASLSAYIANLISKPFDLSADYMLRADLIRLSQDDHLLVATMHHIASDGWSRSILVKEVIALYEGYAAGNQAKLGDLPVQYADYAIWQRRYLQGDALEKKLSYWKAKLDGVAALQLLTDYSRPLAQSSRGATCGFSIEQGLSTDLADLGHSVGATLFMTLLSVFNVLLYRYSRQEDICVGTPIAGRNQQELEGLIGFFVNTLALRSQVKGAMSFIGLLEEVKETTLEAFTHQEVPFEKVVDAVVKERDMSRNPLFQVMFVLQNTPEIPKLSVNALEISVHNAEHITSRFDITFTVIKKSDGLEVSVEYSTDLFKPGTIDRMMQHYRELLYSIAANPETQIGQLKMMSQAEETTLLQEFNDTKTTYPKDRNVVTLFEQQVIKNPDAIAIVFEAEQLTYKELNARANQLARYLQQKGVTAETLVPICLERSLEMMVGVLGILKAGGAYVPIDPAYPAERIKYLLEDTRATIVLSSKTSYEKLLQASIDLDIIELDGKNPAIGKLAADNLHTVIKPNDLAYIIYTSGSTGKPKGVMIEHSSLAHYLLNTKTEYINSEEGGSGSFIHLSYTFDASLTALFMPILAGKLAVISSKNSVDIFDDDNLLKYAPYDFLKITPAHLELIHSKLRDDNGKLLTQRLVIGGEALLAGHFTSIIEENIDVEIINEYGPTEATVGCSTYSFYPVSDYQQIKKSISIGKPIDNTQLYILDDKNDLVAIGIVGQICIGGEGLSRGYLNLPDLTAEKFISNPFSKDQGSRLYQTGDLGRWLPDGNIEYLGRVDDQVKVRGYRIELGEIENVLNQCDQVGQAVVLAKEDSNSNKKLLSYYVPDWQTVKDKEHEHYLQQVATWKELYEIEYGQTEDVAGVDEEFNLIGWNDSFTGLEIPSGQMREWLNDIVNLVLSENPGHVLEIGCGTGLIFYQLAGKVEKYLGADLSRSSINQITSRISKGLRDYGPVELWVSPAHEVSLPDGEKADTILLNSMVQYFPGEGYMDDVIARALSLLNGSGRIIIGDVRDNRLLAMFKMRLQMQKMQSTASLQELNWAVERGILKENELCLSPEYFYKLQSLYPQITHIDIEWKHGSHINELTLYRYNVVIYVGIDRPLITPKWENWKGINQQDILDQLNDGSALIAIKDAPNLRLWKEKLLDNAIQQKAADSLGDLTQIIESEDKETQSIQEILSVAEANGYHYRLLLDEDQFKVNVLFERGTNSGFLKSVYKEDSYSPSEPNANIPLFNEISTALKKDIRLFLQQHLPDYMIPYDFIAVRQLPLTNNGKIDRKALPDPVLTIMAGEYIAPLNETERALAGIWQELLGIERIGIYDNFFELGGDSILTIQVVSRMRRLGYVMQPKDIFNYQEIAGLSAAIDRGMDKEVTGEQGLLSGSFGLLPIQSRYLEKDPAEVSHFNQSVLLKINKSITATVLQTSLNHLIAQHDALRLVYKKSAGVWEQEYGAGEFELEVEDMQEESKDNLPERISAISDKHQRSLSIEAGQLMRMVWMQTPEQEESNRLLIVIHHLAVDGVSWRILLADLELLLNSLMNDGQISLGNKSSSYRQWYLELVKYSKGRKLLRQKPYWEQIVNSYECLPEDKGYAYEVLLKDMHDYQVRLGAEQTRYLLQEVPKVYHTEINDLLLSALCAALCNWSGNGQVVIGLEGHGREAISADIDSSRTVGWFTSLYPVLLKEGTDADALIKGVKEALRRIPDKGLGYGVLKYIEKDPGLQGREPWDILFNYLGQLDTAVGSGSWFKVAAESRGSAASENRVSDTKLSVNSRISGGELVLSWSYSSRHYNQETISKLAGEYTTQLMRLIRHCLEQGKSGSVYTPSDYGLNAEITYQELDHFMKGPYKGKQIKNQIESLYRLSGLQQGMLFHSLYDSNGSYIIQFDCDLIGVNLEVLLASWSSVIRNHSILRSAFYHDSFSVPVQCVFREAELPVEELDFREMDAASQKIALQEYEVAHHARQFDFKSPPLMRLSLVRLADDRYRMIWASHHLLFDGWSLPILMGDFLNSYELLLLGQTSPEASEDRYEDYIHYLERKDKDEEEQYWRGYLNEIKQGTLLPFIREKGQRTKGKGKYETLLLRLDEATTERIQAYAQSYRLTVNTLMQGVWALLLHKYTGNREVLYGVVVSGRPDELQGVEQRVGMYINTLPLKAVFDKQQETVSWLQGLQADQVSSREYQYTALQDIQGWTGIKGDLFDSLLVFENYPVSKLVESRSWSLKVENLKFTAKTNYPLTLDIGSSEDMRIRFGYNTELLEQLYVENIRDQFEQVLLQIIKGEAGTLNDIRLLTALQEQTLIEEFNTTSSETTYQELDSFLGDDDDDNIISF